MSTKLGLVPVRILGLAKLCGAILILAQTANPLDSVKSTTFESEAADPGAFGGTDSSPVEVTGACEVIDFDGTRRKLAGITIRVCEQSRYTQWEHRIFEDLNPKLEDLEDRALEAARQQRRRESRACMKKVTDMLENRWELLPKCPHAMTDKDGSFKLSHTIKAPYFIFADAHITYGAMVEHLHWTLSSTRIDPSNHIFLTDANAHKQVQAE